MQTSQNHGLKMSYDSGICLSRISAAEEKKLSCGHSLHVSCFNQYKKGKGGHAKGTASVRVSEALPSSEMARPDLEKCWANEKFSYERVFL